MPIYQRGKSKVWQIKFSHRGRRIQKSSGTVDKAAAQQLHDKLKAEVWRVSHLKEKPQMLWQHAVKKWVEEKKHKKTIGEDIKLLRWLDPYLRSYYLKDITKQKIDDIITEKRNQNPNVSNARINRILALLRAILTLCVDEWEWLDKMPKIKLLPEPDGRVRWLTKKEAATLIKELSNTPHTQDMAAFTLCVGLREENVCGLTWRQVDLEKRHAWVFVTDTKGKRSIAVPLNDDAIEILKRWEGKHETYVFTYRGHRVNQCNTKAWRNALKRAKIKNFRFHDLRHTWASWHVQNGTSLQELQQLGAWASYQMVLKYAHLSSAHLKSAADRISLK